MRKIAADLLRDERGHVLATVMIVALLVGSLSALALATGSQADRASTTDRNYDQSLGAAEAGVHQAISEFTQRWNSGTTSSFSIATPNAPGAPSVPSGACPSSPLTTPAYPQGSYYACVTQNSQGYVVDSEGFVGAGSTTNTHLGRKRHVRVQLLRPSPFPSGGKYALFSDTNITVKGGDVVNGNVWANKNVTFNQNSSVNASITAAQGWIDLSANSAVITCRTNPLPGGGSYTCPAGNGNVWTGGYNCTATDGSGNCTAGWAVNLGGNSVAGWAKASSSSPCVAGGNTIYSIAGGGSVAGDVTTWGTMPSAIAGGRYTPNTCTAAPAPQTGPTFPAFTFNPANYGCNPYPSSCPSTYHEFSGVSAFQNWLNTGANKSSLQGTFWVQDPSPSESNPVDLSGVNVVGDTTIVTNAPIYSNSASDSGPWQRFVLVSHYAPNANNTPCSLTAQAASSECAIHFKNAFQSTCNTAVLLYADRGPVAVKNNSTACGTIVGNVIDVMNNWTFTYDARFDRVPGFGPDTWEVGTWQELVAQ